MEFRYTRARVYGLLILDATAFALLAGQSVIQWFTQPPKGWRLYFEIGADVLLCVALVVLGRALLQIVNSPWVVRLEPTEVQVQGRKRVKSFSWTELEKARSSLGIPVGTAGFNWGEFLSRPPDSPWISLDRGNVTPRGILAAAVEFYVSSPESRAELADPASCARRLDHIRLEEQARAPQRADEEARRRDEEARRRDEDDMRRGRERPSEPGSRD